MRRRRGFRGGIVARGVLCLAVLGCAPPATSSASAAGTSPTFTADNPPGFAYDRVYGNEYSCGGACSYNEEFGYVFAANADPAPTYSVSSGALPSGIHLDPANGLLYGFPSSSGQAYSFSISASNGTTPNAVAGPFTGTVSSANAESLSDASCLTGGYAPQPEGEGTTTRSNSTNEVPASAVEVTLPNAAAATTRVVGHVIAGGTSTVVYEEQVPVTVSAPQAQALLTAAAAADSKASPGSTLSAPALQGTSVATSPTSLVGEIAPGPPSTQTSIADNSTVGPATIEIGALQSCLFDVKSGTEDIDTLRSYPVAEATEELQATETTTSTYYVDATAAPAPSAPAPAPNLGASPPPTAASTLLLSCSGAKLALTNIYSQGSHVVLEGAAASSLIGSKVKLLFGSARQVASATVAADGFFTAKAPLPPARIRDTNAASYSARDGATRSASLKLTRRLVISSAQVSGSEVKFRGVVLPPLSRPPAPLEVKFASACRRTPRLVGNVKPSGRGAFVVSVAIPPASGSGIFTLESRVRQNAHSKKAFATYSLPQAVQVR